jgi:predicted membrane protein
MSNIFALGFELMGYGLVGVFTTLIAFILMIVGLTKLFPYKDE